MAVVSMIWMHAADGWLVRTYRESIWWPRIVTFGGLAAPLFFTLAGVGLGLAWHATEPAKRGTRLTSQVRRGLQLVVLGYGLRLQMWMIDAGGYRRLVHWLAAIGLGAGYVIAYRALRPKARSSLGTWLVVAALIGVCLATVQHTEPKRLVGLLRVDVLQGIGLATAIVCVVCRAVPPLMQQPLSLLAIGLASAAATGILRTLMPGALPIPIAGYVAAWPIPKGTPATTLFPLFPWMAYTFAGAAFAVRWNQLSTTGKPTRALTLATLSGVVLAFASAETQPWVHGAIQRWPDVVHVVRVIYRLALACALLLPAFWLAKTWVGKQLQALGTASLWVYWVHLELTFGVLAWPVRHDLHIAGWLAGFVALTFAMLGLAVVINAPQRASST